MSRIRLLVIPPSVIAPYPVLLNEIRKITFLIQTRIYNMLNTIKRLSTDLFVIETICGVTASALRRISRLSRKWRAAVGIHNDRLCQIQNPNSNDVPAAMHL